MKEITRSEPFVIGATAKFYVSYDYDPREYSPKRIFSRDKKGQQILFNELTWVFEGLNSEKVEGEKFCTWAGYYTLSKEQTATLEEGIYYLTDKETPAEGELDVPVQETIKFVKRIKTN